MVLKSSIVYQKIKLDTIIQKSKDTFICIPETRKLCIFLTAAHRPVIGRMKWPRLPNEDAFSSAGRHTMVPCQLCLGIKCDLCLCGIRLLMLGSSINNFSEAPHPSSHVASLSFILIHRMDLVLLSQTRSFKTYNWKLY